MLTVSNLVIEYPRGHTRTRVTRAVEDVSFTVGANEKLVIVGPSGCGKSTLLTAIAGFLPITGGSIAIDERPVKAPGMDRVMVFQDLNQFLPWHTVQGNVEWAIRRKWPHMDRGDVRTLARKYVDLVGLSEKADTFPHVLSGGQRQRVAIARSFAVEPSILLLDEPFGALDAITREQMQDQLNAVWREAGTSILFVTHDVDEALALGHRILVMSSNPGRVAAMLENVNTGDPDERRMLSERIRAVIGGGAAGSPVAAMGHDA